MKIILNQKNFSLESQNWLEENQKEIESLLEKVIFFQFSGENHIANLNLRYGEVRPHPSSWKKGITRKVILDKKITGLVKDHFYSLDIETAFFYNPVILFVSGKTEDLTNEIELTSFEVSKKLIWGMSVKKITTFCHPLQDRTEEWKNFPEVFDGFEWSLADLKWENCRQLKNVWRKNLISKIPKDFFHEENPHFGNKIFHLLKVEKVENSYIMANINIETETATLYPVVRVLYKEYSFDMETGFANEENLQKLVDYRSNISIGSDFYFSEVINMAKDKIEIKIKLQETEKKTGEPTSVSYNCVVTLGGDGWRRGTQVNHKEVLRFSVETVRCKVDGLPTGSIEDFFTDGGLYHNSPGKAESKSFFRGEEGDFFIHKYRVILP